MPLNGDFDYVAADKAGTAGYQESHDALRGLSAD
jgi:hypothetical protein